ncbi:MAG TPA: phytoene desaturase family protein [Ktedonobacteraceae bacterium]
MIEQTNQIVIIGAGIGGLSTAIRLAALGERVQVLERQSQVGGRLAQLKVNDFHFDTAPSLITMPHVLRGLFYAAKRRVEDYLDLVPLDLTCRYFYRDGLVLNAWRDHTRLVEEFARLNPHDGDSLRRFLAYVHNIYLVADPFLFKHQENPLEMLLALISYIFRGHAPDTVTQADHSTFLSRCQAVFATFSADTLDQLVARYFQDEHLRLLFNHYATCSGSSPYQMSSAYSILPYIELVDGGWHLRGGISALTRALEKLALELGVTIRTNTNVCRILVEQGMARGVVLPSGQTVRAKVVIANSDIVSTHRELLSPAVCSPRQKRHLTALEPSSSSFALMLGVKGQYPQLARHNVFFSGNDKAEFTDLFDARIPVRNPTISLSVTSRSDETQAPAEHESLFVQVNAPYLTAQSNWRRDAPAYREHILDLLTSYSRAELADLRQRIVCETLLTPEDFQRRYSANAGALYGPSANTRMAFFTRPNNCSQTIRRLYFVGSSTHPGGSIPQVMLSSKIVTNLFLQESY